MQKHPIDYRTLNWEQRQRHRRHVSYARRKVEVTERVQVIKTDKTNYSREIGVVIKSEPRLTGHRINSVMFPDGEIRKFQGYELAGA